MNLHVINMEIVFQWKKGTMMLIPFFFHLLIISLYFSCSFFFYILLLLSSTIFFLYYTFSIFFFIFLLLSIMIFHLCFYIRCDANPDCPEDGSDENDCQVMRLQKGYNKKYSPEKNTTVLIDIEVKDIKLINELESDYTLLVKVTLKWFDPRITFKNLKKSHYENQLGPTEIDTIWTPELLFLHSNEIYIKAGEQKEGIDGTVRVHREGLPQPRNSL